MLCENCGIIQANLRYSIMRNGHTEEHALCTGCAEKLGYIKNDLLFQNLSGWLMPGFFMSPSKSVASAGTCPLCGMSSSDIINTGRAGCERCYDVFSGVLDPYIRKIHGKVSHTGKLPKGASESISAKRRLESLQNELRAAVDSQEFERAAALRDEIRGIQNEGRADGDGEGRI